MRDTLIRRGHAHVFGDNVSLDDGIIPARFAAQRVTEAALLTPRLFENVDASFAARVRPGDIVLAGRNFACGKPRLQGFIAMAALELSVICVSMPYKMLRRAVARALPIALAPHAAELAVTGDEVEIDFGAGVFRNLTQNTRSEIPAMPHILLEIVTSGGAEAALRDWLEKHPEQSVEPA
jgi:3-isopropylmalate/(R)-2-methylmalate dehydratase small subunit